MNIIKVKNYEELSAGAADLVIRQIKKKPNSVLGLPTGSTPLGLYRQLINANNKCQVSFRKVKTFNLDEYYGLTPEDPQSYRYFMDKNLFNKIDIDKKNTHVPPGRFKKSEEKKICRAYEAQIKKAGGIDLQILGLGGNGHIGFNEPRSSFKSRTRLVNLTKKTISDNSRFFAGSDDVPRQAVTIGLATIMEAKKIILIISGENRAPAVAKLIRGKMFESFPGSILRRHPSVTVIVDKSAACKI